VLKFVKSHRKLYLRVFFSLLVSILVLTGGYLGVLQLYGNLHTVIAGQLYRSAQPSVQQIADYHKRFGIRTIVNLRGEQRKADWYQEEIATAKELGISHIDFRMSASRQLSQSEVDQLLQLLKSAEKPVLIHCQAGADRSGLVAALYLAGVANAGEHAAEEQLSLRYGHVGIPVVSGTYAMDETWEMIERLLGYSDS
jgi:protein tyrosine/serine phosphatase